MKAFKCQRTGMLFPADYVENWGRDGIGVGLGPDPVSEALVNVYQGPSAKKTADAWGKNEMFPVAVCGSPLVEVEVTAAEMEELGAVLAAEDPGMKLRGLIMRSRQVAHGRIEHKEGDDHFENTETRRRDLVTNRKTKFIQ